jgi:hypothetical protein
VGSAKELEEGTEGVPQLHKSVLGRATEEDGGGKLVLSKAVLKKT